jgi:hypothetical protein
MDFAGLKLEIHTVQDVDVFVRNLGMKASNRKDRCIVHEQRRVGLRGLIKNDSDYQKARIAATHRQARNGRITDANSEG